MKYLPATVAAIAVGAAVSLGLYWTHEPICLFGLAGLGILKFIIPGHTPPDD